MVLMAGVSQGTRSLHTGSRAVPQRCRGALLRTTEVATRTAFAPNQRITWNSRRSAFNKCLSDLLATHNFCSTPSQPLPEKKSQRCKQTPELSPQAHSGDVSQFQHALVLVVGPILLKPIAPWRVVVPDRHNSLRRCQVLQHSIRLPGTSLTWWKFPRSLVIMSSRTVMIVNRHHRCGSNVVTCVSLTALLHQLTSVTTQHVRHAALAPAKIVGVTAKNTRTTLAKVVGKSQMVPLHATCVDVRALLTMNCPVRLASSLSHYQPISVRQQWT